MKLYTMPGACSLAAHIVLHELGVPHKADIVKRNPRQTEDGRDYLQINPDGYVPALELDDGEILTENGAILPFLGDLKPEKGLIPQEGIDRYRALRWVAFVNTEIHGGYKPYFGGGGDAEKQAAGEKLVKRYRTIDEALAKHPYLMGDTMGVADAYLFVVTRWAERVKLDLSQFTNLAAFMERMKDRDSVVRAMTHEGLLQKAA